MSAGIRLYRSALERRIILRLTSALLKGVRGARESVPIEARAAIHPWVKLYQDERDRLVRVAKAAIDAGVEERQVRLSEQQAQQLGQVIRAILTDLGDDLEDDRVRKVVRLRLLEGAGEGSSPRFSEPSGEASRDGDDVVPEDAS